MLGHHKVSQCLSKGRCKHCKGRHHTTLYRGNSSQNPAPHSHQENSNQTTVNTTLLQKTSELNYVPPSKVCFLKTADAKVRANNYSAQVNILLDEGAQCSFITQSLADSLHLSSQRRVAIAAFGATEPSKQTLPVASIHLETTDGSYICSHHS